MATFSVDITSVTFAGNMTGYKDITITGMPQAGVTCQLNSLHFDYRLPGEEANIYRVFTTGTNKGSSSGSPYTSTFKIINAGDSTDYVEVSLYQFWCNTTSPTILPQKSQYSNIYLYESVDIGLFDYTAPDFTSRMELYVDGYNSATVSDSWIFYVAETTYTDTGFKRILLGCNNNYGDARKGSIRFPGTNSSYGGTFTVFQNAYPSSTAGCTQSVSFSNTGGTLTATLNHSSSFDYSNLVVGNDFHYKGFSDYSTTKSGNTSTQSTCTITVGANSGDDPLKGAVVFYSNRQGYREIYGFTIVNQEGQIPSPSLVVDPTVMTYPASGGGKILSVTFEGTLSTNMSSAPGWLSISTTTIDTTHKSFTITASQNTSTSARSWSFELTDDNMTVAVPISQEGGSATSLTISPTSNSVTSESGSVTITVTSTGISEVNYSISSGWITYGGKNGDVYTFNYTTNNSGTQRQGTITFYGGGLSETYTLTQAAGQSASLVVSPTSESVANTSGSVSVTVTSTGISEVSYSISENWLTYTSKVGDVYTFSYTANSTTSQRQAVVTFSGGGLSRTYTLTQAAGQGASLVVSPSSDVIGKDYARMFVTVTGAPVSSISYSISGSRWISYAGRTNNVYEFECSENTTGSSRTGSITFSATGYTDAVYTISQTTEASPAISVSPDKLYFNLGKQQPLQVTVTYPGSVVADPQSTELTATLVQETGSSHIFNIYAKLPASSLYDNSRRSSVIFYGQNGGSGATVTCYENYLSSDPSSLQFPSGSSSQNITVYVLSSQYTLQVRNKPNWISLSTVSLGDNKRVIRVTATENTTSSDRSGQIHYRISEVGGSGDNVNLHIPVSQSSGSTPVTSPSLRANPSRLRYYSVAGRRYVSFNYIPSSGIDYTITYTDGSGWLSVADYGNRKSVVATANDGIRRRATIRFYEHSNSFNYVDVAVIQGSINYYNSIWMDDLYYPENRDQDDNYYYRIVDQTTGHTFFEGISTIPSGWSGDIGGINVPRLVDNGLISGNFLYYQGDQWNRMIDSYCTADLYNMTETGYPGVLEETFKYFNDWSRVETRYDYTRYINDPINGKGCDKMYIPSTVYYDDDEGGTFSISEVDMDGTVNTYTLDTPEYPFVTRWDTYYNTKLLDYKLNDEVIFSYDMTHCGRGAFIYRNRFGGWDSFLIEGNISKKDAYTKENYRKKGEYNQDMSIDNLHYDDEKYTDSIDIVASFEAYTGWLTDEESERLVYHLLSSPLVYFQDLDTNNYPIHPELMPVTITASEAEYKKFRNGRRLVNYLITFENCNIQKVRN